jgi:thiamine biosynthesis lipoprotein
MAVQAARSYSFEAIGTHWQIDIFSDVSDEHFEVAKIAVTERISEFDLTYSRFRKDSLVSKISKQAGTYSFPPDSQKLFTLYEKLYQLTGGDFSPLVGNLVSDAGYDAHYGLVTKDLSSPPPWEEVMHFHYPNLTVFKPFILDFGAAGKGYLVDLVGELLESHGMLAYTVDAGGDIRHRGDFHLEVGLENPHDTTEVVGVAELTNTSICGSAGNRRAWGAFHHIIHPKKLQSPKHLAATWVVADSTLLADALATCLYFVSPEKLREEFSFNYAILDSEGVVQASPRFSATFFT